MYIVFTYELYIFLGNLEISIKNNILICSLKKVFKYITHKMNFFLSKLICNIQRSN